MTKNEEQKIKIVFKNDLTFEEQIKKVEKMNDIFVDIATNYCITKIKEGKKA